ncbi:glycosyltransferase [Ochrobactrum daejeonense]|nr:glycosyltransferase [Brucella daejeonensis]
MKISIVVPCYNARGKIETCIGSLRSIDFPAEEFEVIFVDDCSTDGTHSYLAGICEGRRIGRCISSPPIVARLPGREITVP